jgi:hypothetical protein
MTLQSRSFDCKTFNGNNRFLKTALPIFSFLQELVQKIKELKEMLEIKSDAVEGSYYMSGFAKTIITFP